MLTLNNDSYART